mmetsp:Transcript_2650/g.5912  ORF Transcript_2650/g.5912 Transcript_2650/m.5912 type:complete len:224 (-) Transcript_2650:162-833(-)
MVYQEQDHYSILGLKARASQTEVKKAYRSLCKRYHPDKAVHLDEATRREREAQMVKLNVAYQVLNSPKQRFEYDLAQPCPEEKRAADLYPEGEVPFAAGFRASTPNQRSSMGSANPGTRFRYPYSAKYTQRSRQARRMDPSQYTTHVDGRAAEFTGRSPAAHQEEEKATGLRRGSLHRMTQIMRGCSLSVMPHRFIVQGHAVGTARDGPGTRVDAGFLSTRAS